MLGAVHHESNYNAVSIAPTARSNDEGEIFARRVSDWPFPFVRLFVFALHFLYQLNFGLDFCIVSVHITYKTDHDQTYS